MADHRRKRGALKDAVGLGWEVERVKRERFKAIAANCEVSAAVLFEALVDHLETELTDEEVPVWMPKKDRSEELPIPSA